MKEKLDPRNPAHDGEWSDERKLSSIFLETILLHEPFRSAIPRQGVRIIGAYFPNFIDLTDASIERPLLLHKSRFRSQVDMNRLRTLASISLEGSKFDGDLNMDSASVGGGLFMRRAEFGEVVLRGVEIGDQLDMEWATFKGKLNMDAASIGVNLFMRKAAFREVNLRGAKIGDQLDMEWATFKGKLNMDAASIGVNLFMRKAAFREVNLRGAKIGDQLEMNESIFKGKLNMDSASIGVNLFMRKAAFREVNLRGAKIGDQLEMEGAIFKGKLNMDSASVGSSLFMGKAELNKPANLIFLSVGSGLNARGVMLRGLDLTGARIEGELHLGLSDANIEWKSYTDENGDRQAPKLTLRNTSVGTLQDTKDTWPDHLEREFEGFIYDRLGGFGASE